MAMILSIPAAVTVLAPGSSVLSTVAASMAPGTWAHISVPNQNTILGVGTTTGSILPYCNAFPWNSKNRSIEIIGGDHYAPTGLRHVRYVEATNSFELVAETTGFRGHGYDHTEVNPYTGEIYHRSRGATGMKPLVVHRQALGRLEWDPIDGVVVNQIIIAGTCWWSGPFTGGQGLSAHGGFAVYSRADTGFSAPSDGNISIFDPLANSWRFSANGMSPNLTISATSSEYNQVMAYSAVKNVAVYGGGHGNEQRIWRLSSNGVATELTNAPAEIAIGIHAGVLVEDPVTGNFLVLSKGHIYELNPEGPGTWTRQTGRRVPPESVGIPAGSGPRKCVIGVPLPDHGLVAFIRQSNAASSAFWLYRHA
jgi:hypothetical protein